MTALLVLALGCADPPPSVDSEAPRADPLVLGLCLNEVMPRSELGADWFEIVGPPELALDGWSALWDREQPESASLDGFTVPSSGFLRVWVGSAPTEEEPFLPFGLDGDGEALGLEAPDGSRAWISWGPMASDMSLARVPDCCTDPDCWRVVTGGTPGSTNGVEAAAR